MQMRFRQVPSSRIYLLAAIISLALSCWMGYAMQVINPDGICYLQSADQFRLTHQLHAAMQTCSQASWPFYSVLVASVADIVHLSTLHAALGVNAIFSCVSVLLFMAIVQQLGGRQLLTLGAIVILCAHDFNGTRLYIVRDHGFWTFYLASLYFFVRFMQQQRFSLAFMWSASLMVAFLFRLEGGVFLIFAPFVILFQTQKKLAQRCKAFFQLHAFAIVLILAAGISLSFLHKLDLLHFGRLTEFAENMSRSILVIADRFQQTKAVFARDILSVYAKSDAGLILAVTFIVWYFISVIKSLSWAYALLILAYSRIKHYIANMQHRAVAAYIFINVLITFAFLLEAHFISKRYLVALSLTLMLYVPFAMQQLIEDYRHARHKIFAWFVVLLFAISTVSGIQSFGYSKGYLREAGAWLQQNVKPTDSFYSNDLQLLYDSHHFNQALFTTYDHYRQINITENHAWQKYHYIALRLDGHDAETEQKQLAKIAIPSLIVFKNKRNDKVVIYKVSQEKRN